MVTPYDLSVSFATWRQNPAFVDATLVAVEAPPNLLGDYHLNDCPASPACNLGAASKAVPGYQQPPANLAAPAVDIDDEVRPARGGFDAGSDEFGSTPATPPPASDLYFSTAGNTNPPGVTGTADDADIYRWNGSAFSRSIDMTAAPYNLPGRRERRRLRPGGRHALLRCPSATPPWCPGSGPCRTRTSSTGTAAPGRCGSTAAPTAWADAGLDVDAISVAGSTLYFSTTGNTGAAGRRRHR